jgi:two-component system, chemotaxis family, chemotaxis protein CheY
MFTKPEAQLIARTLTQRRDWLLKNIDNPEHAAAKEQNKKVLELIESSLAKLLQLFKPVQAPVDIISAPATPAKPAKMPIAQKRAQMQPADIKVLVVDDDHLISSIMQVLLNSYGIQQIDIADDGLKAISMLYDANPVYDLVLCDWNMPIKSGLDVHNAMRAAERYMDACFMLVTAVTQAKQIRAAIEEGVDDYVVKPIEEEKIIKKIQRYFPKIGDREEKHE